MLDYVAVKRIIATSQSLENPMPLFMDYARLRKRGRFYIVETKGGHKLKLRSGTSDRFILCENYPRSDYFEMGQKISPGDVVVDLGANYGIFTILASGYDPKIIYSVEPSSGNISLLRNNVAANRLKNVLTFQVAVGGHDGSIKLYENQTKGAYHSIYPAIDGRKQTQFTSVEIKTLETFFRENNIERCNYLKMDIEGAEHDIFERANRDFFERIDQITIEIHRAGGKFINEIIDRLHALDYEIAGRKWRLVYAKKKMKS